MQPWFNGNSFAEADLCVYGGAAFGGWGVALPIGAAVRDLVGVLTHEFGHVLGLDHTPDVVMSSWSFGPGNTLARYPYGDDIAGMRALYGTKTVSPYWKAYDSGTNSWGAAYGTGNTTALHPTAALGSYVSGGYLLKRAMVGYTGGGNQQLYWKRSEYPLSSSSTWDNWTMGGTYLTWRPSAMGGMEVSAPSPYRWVMAWPNQQTTLANPTCSGTRIFTSESSFEAGTVYSFNDCTLHTMAVAHDRASGYWIVAWVDHSDSSSNDKVFARTSSDGATWSSPQDFDTRTIDGVSLACMGTGQCLIGFARGTSNDAYVNLWAFSVNSSGQIVIGSGTGVADRVQRTPQVTTFSSDKNMFLEHWTDNATNLSNGSGTLYSSWDNSFPPSTVHWGYLNINSQNTPALAGMPGLAIPYAFLVNP